MNQPIPNTAILTAIAARFPEILEDLTSFGWIWAQAAVEVMGIDKDGGLLDFVGTLADRYRKLPEIPDYRERLFFALAAQRCHPDMINKALVVARDDCGLPGPFIMWRQGGSLPGRWQCWNFTRNFLTHPVCFHGGKFPDQLGLTRYIKQVEQRYQQLVEQTGVV